ncbi:MAG: ABC transporter substrate-binding protein, partial [Spirochaetota bacterium]
IPVVALNYGDLARNREVLYASLRLMARILGTEERAEQVVAFFETAIRDLHRRTADVPEGDKKSCYVGGIAFKGPHGLRSTEPNYPPFLFVNARNLAHDPGGPLGELTHAVVAKEKILQWDPEYLFIDLSTLQAGTGSGALHELRTDPAYRSLRAVERGNVFGVFPYNWYTQNFGSTLANAYFIGTVLYPDRFAGVEPVERAEEIYRFLVGEAVFERMNSMFGNNAFRRLGPDQPATGPGRGD